MNAPLILVEARLAAGTHEDGVKDPKWLPSSHFWF